jgi:hypothetical protein
MAVGDIWDEASDRARPGTGVSLEELDALPRLIPFGLVSESDAPAPTESAQAAELDARGEPAKASDAADGSGSADRADGPDRADAGDTPEAPAGARAEAARAGREKSRLSVLKVLPTEAKHRGTSRRRASAQRQADIALAELDDVDLAMRRRNEILLAAIKRTQELYIVTDQRQIFRLAAADVFVERSQLVLRQRGRTMWRAGVVATVGAVVLLVALAAFLVWRAQAIASPAPTGNQLTLGLVEMLGPVVIVFIAVRYLVRLSGSFFQQNVETAAKQHGLGFGRLFVYANPDSVRLKDLQDAFGLDLDSTPIFLDIKAKEANASIYSKLTQDFGSPSSR